MCHTFLEPQAQADLNDDGNVRNGKNVGNVRNFGNIRNAEISGMSGSSVIPFRNHKDLQILHGLRLGMSVMVGILGISECQKCYECQDTDRHQV